ncbi:hypothetical protein RF11_02447 [Thelohanellus kitauei]|uniref:Uncharacterized protein n=1 Tax=Thelohanellus kitauei TaxID=669202 RepID=A0A0C2JAT4_THEKT|nr:hypothetical protein RF11_02447 [Thelohanellus kitauei]
MCWRPISEVTSYRNPCKLFVQSYALKRLTFLTKFHFHNRLLSEESDLSYNIFEHLSDKHVHCKYFSLAVDESIDNVDTAQLEEHLAEFNEIDKEEIDGVYSPKIAEHQRCLSSDENEHFPTQNKNESLGFVKQCTYLKNIAA